MGRSRGGGFLIRASCNRLVFAAILHSYLRLCRVFCRGGGEMNLDVKCTFEVENCVGTKKTGKGRRKIGRKKRRMRAKIRHRKD